MTKEGKIIVGITVGAAVAFITWRLVVYFNRLKSAETEPAPANNSTASAGSSLAGAGSSAPNYSSDAFPLKLYSGGENVKKLQKALNLGVKYLGFSTTDILYADGKYGANTEGLVNLFKGAIGLTKNGQVSKAEFDKYISPIYADSLTSPVVPSTPMTATEFAQFMWGG